MEQAGGADLEGLLRQMKSQAAAGLLRITRHAHEEMVEEEIGVEDVLLALRRSEILEHYPEHRRGSCCLLLGITKPGRPLHLVCTTAQPVLVLITVYEPKPPKWVTPTQRGRKP
jgi:hypothetical protein